MTDKVPTTVQKIFLPYFFDIVAPFLAYFVVHRFGARTILALTVGGLIAAANTAVNTIRRKGLDRIALPPEDISAAQAPAMIFLIMLPSCCACLSGGRNQGAFPAIDIELKYSCRRAPRFLLAPS